MSSPREPPADDNIPSNDMARGEGVKVMSADPWTTDRFAHIAPTSNAQSNIVSLFKSCIDQDLAGDELRTEVAESLQIEDVCSADVLSNSDLFRRIRHV